MARIRMAGWQQTRRGKEGDSLLILAPALLLLRPLLPPTPTPPPTFVTIAKRLHHRQRRASSDAGERSYARLRSSPRQPFRPLVPTCARQSAHRSRQKGRRTRVRVTPRHLRIGARGGGGDVAPGLMMMVEPAGLLAGHAAASRGRRESGGKFFARQPLGREEAAPPPTNRLPECAAAGMHTSNELTKHRQLILSVPFEFITNWNLQSLARPSASHKFVYSFCANSAF